MSLGKSNSTKMNVICVPRALRAQEMKVLPSVPFFVHNNDTVYWMDIFSHIFVVKIEIFVLKRPKINEKEAGLAHFL